MGEIARAGQAPVPRLSGRRPLERNRLSGPLAQVRADAAYLVREGHRRGLVVTQTEVESQGGQVMVDVSYYPAPARTARPLWRRTPTSRKQWAAAISTGVLMLGGCAYGVVVLVEAIVTAVNEAVRVVATGALGVILILAAIAGIKLLLSGGGTWTGSGTWR